VLKNQENLTRLFKKFQVDRPLGTSKGVSVALNMFGAILRRVAQPPASGPSSSLLNLRSAWTSPIAASSAFSPTLSRYRLGARMFSISGYNSQVTAILGGQWGDEGKGKLVDILAGKFDIVGRFNGGSNAGHTIVVNGKKFPFHLLPCGMLYPKTVNVIGNGVVLHVPTLLKELKNLDNNQISYKGRLLVSNRAHLLFDFHQVIDGRQEAALKDKNIGTTKKGIGPCYTSKATRNGIRVGELEDFEAFSSKLRNLYSVLSKQYDFTHDIEEEISRFRAYRDFLMPITIDNVSYMNQALREGKTVLAEGANAALLDLDFGTYPFVTSSSTTAGGICTGLGISPNKIETSIGIVKAYTTRVGEGPFPTELTDTIGAEMRKIGHEFGTTTGRPRRCGWMDIPVAAYGHLLNGYSSINITKLDVLSTFKDIKIGVSYSIDGKVLPYGYMPSTLAELAKVKVNYETLPGWQCDISGVRDFAKLPIQAQNYCNRIEQLLGVPVSWVGTGPGREQMATKGFNVQ
jgi:adenylosuccinate synthase